MTKTVIFEEKYGVNINNFSGTDEIDEVVEKWKGRKMEVIVIGSCGREI